MTMAIPVGAKQAVSIHPDTSIGAVSLTVTDLDRSRSFYEQAIGLRAFDRADGSLAFGTDADHPLIELHGDSTAPALNPRVTGLYHLAILVPSRRDLALALARLAQARWPLGGASDHLVSEALYLSDPDGNGIEIYRDRPREQWSRTPEEGLRMATLPLDLDHLLGELAAADGLQELAPPGTTIGHAHLQVSDLSAAERFYNGVLGFDVIVRGYPGALFVSAGGYHHHVGLNSWRSAGASPPPPGSIGLRSFEVVLPTPDELDAVLGRIRSAGLQVESFGRDPLVRDPSGNGVVLRSAPPT
jgi:catechol 2,3-dioxygenase